MVKTLTKIFIISVVIGILLIPPKSNADNKLVSDSLSSREDSYQLTYITFGSQRGLLVAQNEANQVVDINVSGPENISSQTWQKYLLGFLIYLGLIFVWIFSPAGMIFIGFSLIKHLIKPRNIQILSLVFQVLSLVVTLGFFGLVILGIISFNYYYEIYPIVNINLVFGLPVILAGMTVLIGCILVMVLQNRQHPGEGENLSLESIQKLDSAIKPPKKIKVKRGGKANNEEKKLPKPKRIVMLVW